MQMETWWKMIRKTRITKIHRRQQKANNLAVDKVFIKLSPALTFIMNIKKAKMQRRVCCQVLDEKLAAALCNNLFAAQ